MKKSKIIKYTLILIFIAILISLGLISYYYYFNIYPTQKLISDINNQATKLLESSNYYYETTTLTSTGCKQWIKDNKLKYEFFKKGKLYYTIYEDFEKNTSIYLYEKNKEYVIFEDEILIHPGLLTYPIMPLYFPKENIESEKLNGIDCYKFISQNNIIWVNKNTLYPIQESLTYSIHDTFETSIRNFEIKNNIVTEEDVTFINKNNEYTLIDVNEEILNNIPREEHLD